MDNRTYFERKDENVVVEEVMTNELQRLVMHGFNHNHMHGVMINIEASPF